jgi:hypothetical protein
METSVDTVVLRHSYADESYRYTFENGRGFSSSVPNGAVVNHGVRLSFDDGLICVMTKDGRSELYEAGGTLAEDGDYYFTIISTMTVAAPDLSIFTEEDIGGSEEVDLNELERDAETMNALLDSMAALERTTPGDRNMQTMFSFRILTKPTRDFPVFNAPNGFVIDSVTQDGVSVEPTGARSSRLVRDGVYTITLKDEVSSSPPYAVRLEQRRTPPVIMLEGVGKYGITGGDVTVSAAEAVTLNVYRNNIEINSDGAYSENGTYHVVATDLAGNTATADFEIVFVIPKSLILAVIFVLLAAGCAYVIYSRRSMIV